MRNIIFETGKKIVLKGNYFTLVKKVTKNIFLSIEDKTNKIEMLTKDKLLNLYKSGKLRIVARDIPQQPSKKDSINKNDNDIYIKRVKHIVIHRTTIDLSISAEQSQLPHGQPWKTLCIDIFSRAIVSSLISFE